MRLQAGKLLSNLASQRALKLKFLIANSVQPVPEFFLHNFATLGKLDSKRYFHVITVILHCGMYEKHQHRRVNKKPKSILNV